MKRAVILFGHGSRDPAWRRPLEAVAERIARRPELAVACAYLELQQPDLATAAAELVAAGAGSLRVVPLFLGVGKHLRQDLPVLVEQLRGRYPAVAIELAPAVGEDARLLDLLADIASG